MNLDRGTPHAVLAIANDAEKRTQNQIVALKRHLKVLGDGLAKAYSDVAAPAFTAAHGRAPASIADVGEALKDEPTYHAWSDLQQTAQAMMWQSVGDTIYREEGRITDAAKDLARRRPAGGSLKLDPSIPKPDDVMIVDIHGQPGGYMLDRGPDDVVAGAFYESGGNVYVFGLGHGVRDSKAGVVMEQYRKLTDGKTTPQRILDIGCAAGGATLPFKLAFPDAEIHAIDVGAGLVRYAHARAESFGIPIHFRQMNGVALGYDSNSFDLVVAHNLMHEVSTANLRLILAETFRVLKPGGIAIFQDVPTRYRGKPLIEQFMSSWQTINNNEPHWDAFAMCDVPSLMVEAGFPVASTTDLDAPRLGAPGVWYVAASIKPQHAGAQA